MIDKNSTLKRLNEIFLAMPQWEGSQLLNLCKDFIAVIPHRLFTDHKDWLHTEDVASALIRFDKDYVAARAYVSFWMEIKINHLETLDGGLFISSPLAEKLNTEIGLFGKKDSPRNHARDLVKGSRLATMLKPRHLCSIDEMLVLRELRTMIKEFQNVNK